VIVTIDRMSELTEATAIASLAPAQAIELALEQPTLCAAFQVTAAANAGRPALRTLGSGGECRWSEYAERLRSIASGLYAVGVRPGDAVALMLSNCSEFHMLDSAAMHLGAAPFSIYFTNPAEQIEPMIRNSEARVVFAHPQHVETMLEVQRRTGLIEHVIVLGDDAGAGTMTLAELEALQSPLDFDFEATWRAIVPDDIAGIVYTSGTTGEPKGVEWSHGALLENMRGLNKLAPPSPAGRWVSYLPMAHLAERFMSHYCSMAFGYTITTAPDIKQLAGALVETRPTRFFAVPRVYEKLGEGAKAIAAGDDRLREALEISLRAVGEVESGAADPELVAAAEDARKRLAPIREKVGLDATEYRGAASAPMREDTHHLFTALGLPVAELWGMTETALTVSNPPERIKMGTVGKPQPGVEAKLAEDGELLIRGPIFARYRNDPERTRQAFDADGWLHTGDVATVDQDGYYKIVDRKKEIIINSAGKNIAPAMVENRVKQQSPLIGHVVAIGDRRSYLTALIVLDEEALQEFASRNGLSGSFAELARDETVRAEVEHAVTEANSTLARIEQVKRFTILDRGWLPGGDEVTQTMKLKRRVINTKYSQEIETLYS
jgi:long-subunit acyl-CoA synthetase (AMP-forming)